MLSSYNLNQLYNILEMVYKQYKDGLISEREYCKRVKPIDMAIGILEMSTLQDTLVLKESSLQHTLKPKL